MSKWEALAHKFEKASKKKHSKQYLIPSCKFTLFSIRYRIQAWQNSSRPIVSGLITI